MRFFRNYRNDARVIGIGSAWAGIVLAGCATSVSGPRYAVEASAEARAISEASGSAWVVSTQGRAATDAVDETFRAGGNVMDAAIAASFVISVERPQSTGLGGGGFLLYREAKSGRVYALDFRERAPASAREGMYLDPKGEVVEGRSTVGATAVAVPGLVRGLADLHARFGRKPWRELVAPAIRLAETGIAVYPHLAEALAEEAETLAKFPSSRKIFLRPDGQPYALGEKIVQTDLARTLREVAAQGPQAFYRGRIAGAISRATERRVSRADLAGYRAKWREPVRVSFREGGRDFELVSMPPPSSGGVHVAQIVKQLEGAGLKESGFQSATSLHRVAAAMQAAFVDRARYLGDPDFTKVPTRTLVSPAHIARLRALSDPERARSADALGEASPVLPESSDTTHFSIMDAEGNVIVSTQTVNGYFGSGLVAEGTGVVLNNEMDDFSAKPGASNLFGAIGSKANAIRAGKTPLSSMSPTIVLEGGRPRLAVGAPGGTRIITCVAQTILNYLFYGLPLYDAVNALRIHQQWKPDVLRVENPGLPPETERKLERLGWKIQHADAACAVMAVAREGDRLVGVSEPRDFGKAFAR